MSSFITKTIIWEGKQVQVLMPNPQPTSNQNQPKSNKLTIAVVAIAMFAIMLGANYQPQTEAKTTGQIASGVTEYRN